MLYLGSVNTLHVLRKTKSGMVLGDNEGGREAFLPNRYVPKGLAPADSIDVFLYTDSDECVVATTQTPGILIHQFAVLEVSDVTDVGAFLEWGMEKDLFLPFAEQEYAVQAGDRVTVFLLLDERTGRLIASAKIEEFIEPEITVEKGEEVDLLIDRESEIGYYVIINNRHLGLVYSNEVFQVLSRGDRLKGYIKNIRDDGKIDISLQKQGYEQVIDSTESLIKKLQDNNGVIYLTDKSDPKLIAQELQISKKAFKKCVGALYRQRKIKIEADRIVLSD